jgi:hypothetical protein
MKADVPRRQSHHAPNQIISHEVHEELVAHAVRRLAAEVIHLQYRFETSQIALRLPPATIELGDLVGRLSFRVQQAGHHHQLFRAESFLSHPHAHLAERQFVGHGLPSPFIAHLRHRLVSRYDHFSDLGHLLVLLLRQLL